MTNRKVVPAILILILTLSLLPSVINAQNNDSPISEGTIWEKEYDGEGKERIEIYPDPNGNFILIQGSDLDLIDSDGEKLFSKSFSNSIVGRPTVKDDKLYIQTQEMIIRNGYRRTGRLYCLDYRDGSQIWKKDIDYSCTNILVTDNEKIYLPHGSGDNITKLSSEGEVIWQKEYPSASNVSYHVSYGHILYDGIIDDKIVYQSDSNILCIDSDGDVEWRNSIEGEYIRNIQVDRGTATTYISTPKKIYKLDFEGEMETLHEVDKGEYIDDFGFQNDRLYYILDDHRKNLENYRENHTYRIYLKSISKEGEELLNVSLGNFQWNIELVGCEYIGMNLPGNEWIYCQYGNITKDHRYYVFKIKAFDLDGEQKWSHIYNGGKVHSPLRVSKEGVIATKMKEGKLYAYQGYDPGSELRLILYLILGLVSMVLVLAGVLFYYIKDHV